MDLSSLLFLATICFFAMVSPGPDFVVITKNALSYPLRPALATAIGVVCGCLFHATYCIVGLAVIITQSITAFSIIKLVGALYLIYLGVQGLRSDPTPKASGGLSPVLRTPGVGQAFFEGFLCNALNPKCALFLLSLFTQFISPQANMLEKIQVATVFVFESALYWPALVLLLQGRAIRSAISRWRVAVDRICGTLLVALGLKVALSHQR